MSTELSSRSQLILAKIETTEGSDSSPTGAANAVLCSALSAKSLEGESIDLDYIRASFGNSPKLRVNDYGTYSMTVDIAGSGTAGSVPAWGPLLRGCAALETTQTALTGTAAAGAAGTITLAGTAPTTVDLLVGLPITITSGTGSGQTRWIKAYSASRVASIFGSWDTTPDNTSAYSIPAFAFYKPISTGFESLSVYRTIDTMLFKGLAGKGNAVFDLTAKQRPNIKFDYMATYNAPDNTGGSITPVYTSWKRPVPVNSANTTGYFLGLPIDGSASGLQVQNFSFDLGVQVAKRQLIGVEKIKVTDRKSKGSVTFDAVPTTLKTVHEYIRTVSSDPLLITHGTTAGNRFSLFAADVSLDDLADGEDNGTAQFQCNFSANPIDGNDEFRIVVF